MANSGEEYGAASAARIDRVCRGLLATCCRYQVMFKENTYFCRGVLKGLETCKFLSWIWNLRSLIIELLICLAKPECTILVFLPGLQVYGLDLLAGPHSFPPFDLAQPNSSLVSYGDPPGDHQHLRRVSEHAACPRCREWVEQPFQEGGAGRGWPGARTPSFDFGC